MGRGDPAGPSIGRRAGSGIGGSPKALSSPSIPVLVLDPSIVRILAAFMAAGTSVGLLAFSRRGHVLAGGHPEYRAEANPPRFLQVLWPAVNLVPQLYPFAVAIAPDLAYVAAPRFALPFESGVQLVGFVLWGLGGLLVLWSGRVLGRFMVLQIAVSKDHRLVTEGPFARIRHPTYTGVMAMALGAGLLFLNIALLAVALVTITVAHYRAFREERLLASPQGFWEDYRGYMARTGRFLPRFRRS